MEPWKDPRRLEDLWSLEGRPESEDKAERWFQAVEERILFVGHFHSWLATRRPGGRLEWDGARMLELSEPHRYTVLVGPVLLGWCATFDSESCELTPIRCAA